MTSLEAQLDGFLAPALRSLRTKLSYSSFCKSVNVDLLGSLYFLSAE